MTKAEQIFVTRMVPHIEAGLSFEAAAKAVLEDDERLYLQAHVVASAMAEDVYNKLRK